MKKLLTLSALAALGYVGFHQYKKQLDPQRTQESNSNEKEWPALGEIVHRHQGIPIYSNGEKYEVSHGKHFATDGYYYGHKWQCVEFIKRYFYDKHQHQMPSPWGHAKDYFDPAIPHGSINPARNLVQYRNALATPPKPDDLLVWGGNYGHVAIITEVHADHIIVAQQNTKHAPLAKLPLIVEKNSYTLGKNSDSSELSNRPLGWLRIP